MNTWGYTSWSKLGWVRIKDGIELKSYSACWMKDLGNNKYETAKIIFWAARPVLAMKEIIASNKHPEEFHHKEIVNTRRPHK